MNSGHTELKANAISTDGRLAHVGKAIRARARIGWINRHVVRWLDTGAVETLTATQVNRLLRDYRSDDRRLGDGK